MALSPGSTEDFDVCRYIEGSEWREGRCPHCGAPHWKTIPTPFIREHIAEHCATWVKWREKWDRRDDVEMEDMLSDWTPNHLLECLACGWDSDSPQGLRPEPERYCHEQRDYL